MKILYIMHVDWNWAKQRPHFLAEELTNLGNDIHVVNFLIPKKVNTSRNSKALIKNRVLYLLPQLRSVDLLKFISFSINRLIVHLYDRILRPDYIWITHPELWPLVKGTKSKIIYDCMDIAEEFIKDKVYRTKIKNMEAELLHWSEINIFTSEFIKKRAESMYKITSKRNLLVRNGHSIDIHGEKPEKGQAIRRVLYFGTISHWLDFESIRVLCDMGLEVDLIGPSEIVLPQIRNMNWHGSMSHVDLIAKSLEYDAFIMPFVVNDLILGVDPVKLYEYIALGKEVITVQYPEIERFGQFVHFYDDRLRLISIVERIVSNKIERRNTGEAEEFLKESKWTERARVIDGEINV